MTGLFDLDPFTEGVPREQMVELSAGRRRTLAAANAIERGEHPANGLPIDTAHTCGECVFLRTRRVAKVYHKCEFHRLGISRSDASDMRSSWPACPHFAAGDPS